MHKDVTAFYNSRKAKDFYRHPSYDPDRHQLAISWNGEKILAHVPGHGWDNIEGR
jgi:hypothetical protein